MTSQVEAIVHRLHAAERDLRQDLTDQATRWNFRLHRHKALFPPEVRRAHRALRPSLLTFIKAARPLPLLTAPVIYSVFVPLVILDAWMTLYQWICFPVYSIPRVRRLSYLVIDHHRLAYLNAVEKVHCVYCSYANGLIAYVREIAARTEQYWCPIKHALPIVAPHGRYHRFVDYGDAQGYRRELETLRRTWPSEDQDAPSPELSRPSTTTARAARGPRRRAARGA
jgi:hypothetical protein